MSGDITMSTDEEIDWETWLPDDLKGKEESKQIMDEWNVICRIRCGELWSRSDEGTEDREDISQEELQWNDLMRQTRSIRVQDDDWIDTDIIEEPTGGGTHSCNKVTKAFSHTEHRLISRAQRGQYCAYCPIGLFGNVGDRMRCQRPFEHAFLFLEKIYTTAVNVVKRSDDTWYERLFDLCMLCQDSCWIFRDRSKERDPTVYAQLDSTVREGRSPNTLRMEFRSLKGEEVFAIEDVCEQIVRATLIHHERFLIKCMTIHFKRDSKRPKEEVHNLTRAFFSRLYKVEM